MILSVSHGAENISVHYMLCLILLMPEAFVIERYKYDRIAFELYLRNGGKKTVSSEDIQRYGNLTNDWRVKLAALSSDQHSTKWLNRLLGIICYWWNHSWAGSTKQRGSAILSHKKIWGNPWNCSWRTINYWIIGSSQKDTINHKKPAGPFPTSYPHCILLVWSSLSVLYGTCYNRNVFCFIWFIWRRRALTLQWTPPIPRMNTGSITKMS